MLFCFFFCRGNLRLQRTDLAISMSTASVARMQMEKAKTLDAKLNPAGPSWTVSSWLVSLQLFDIISRELTKDMDPSEAEADYIKSLSQEKVKAAVANALPALQDGLMRGHGELKKQEHVDATALNNKFSAAEGSFTFKYGGMDMYHAGLEGLIGLPAPDIERKMEWEHTESWYAQETFDCSYIDGGTTANTEYDYVNSPAIEASCRNGLRDANHSCWTLQHFMDDNADLIKKAGLQLAEVMALRLYTGPMYLWYNNVLRFCKSATGPSWLKHIVTWKEHHATDEPPFVTTLHVLNSAILKLSKVQPAQTVYRGNQGGVLPKEFWEPNEDNIRGGIELGFMSTTTKRAVAVKYSTENEDKASMIFEIQVSGDQFCR